MILLPSPQPSRLGTASTVGDVLESAATNEQGSFMCTQSVLYAVLQSWMILGSSRGVVRLCEGMGADAGAVMVAGEQLRALLTPTQAVPSRCLRAPIEQLLLV